MESRSYVIAASGLMRASDISAAVPYAAEIRAASGEFLANGASAIAAPDGSWLIEPVIGEEVLLVAELDHALVRRERHNLDIVGHYSRPDVTRLQVNRRRQSTLLLDDSDADTADDTRDT